MLKLTSRLIFFVLGAALMGLLSAQVHIMNLPPQWSRYFGSGAAVLLFIALFEQPHPDERQRQLAWQSSHIAFLVISTVLAGILLYQTIVWNVDFWIVAAIAALIVGKVIGRIISERNS